MTLSCDDKSKIKMRLPAVMVNENDNPGTIVDGNGREHVVYTHMGRVTLFNRAGVFHSSNARRWTQSTAMITVRSS